MDKCITVIVTCLVLCYSTTARSYGGYNNHRFDRHEHQVSDHRYHDDGKWRDDVKWYDQGHDDGKWHKDGSSEEGWDFSHGYNHKEPLDNKDNTGHADCDHSSEYYGHHSQDLGHQPFGHQQNYGQHYHHPSQNVAHPQYGYDHHSYHSSYPPHKPHKEFGQPSSEDFGDHSQSGQGSQDWNKKDGESLNDQPIWNPYEQRWVFPDAFDQYTRPTTKPSPSSWSSPPRKPTTANPIPNTSSSSTTTPLTVLLCIRTCPVTPEYNPVCGSNNITYNNIGRLECAKNCGVDVTMQRASPCALPLAPTTMAASNQTSQRPTLPPVTNAPLTDTKPTRFTTIDVNPGSDPNRPSGTESPIKPFTIPPDVLASVFTNPMSDEDKAEYEIDIRTRFSNTKEKA